MDIKALAQEYESYIIDRRRYYHTCPEVSAEEKNTRAAIKADLEAMGITDIREMTTCYGLVAKIKGGKPGKTVALRADIDALPVIETTGLSFASKNEGKMHACGHDSHIAMLLGAAKILSTVKDELCGDVVLVVQPEEESCQGAKKMIAEGAIDGVDAIYGCHIWGNFDAPFLSAEGGNRMAAFHTFKITVDGVAAHGSAPNLGKDAVTASAAIISNLQQVISRQNDPLNPSVCTIGTVHGGSRFNVIANKVVMEGTCRTYAEGTWLEDHMRKIIEGTAKSLGVTASLEYYYGCGPIINKDEDLIKLTQNAAAKLYGEEANGHLPTMMASEDFAYYMEKVPGIFTFLGSRNKELGLVYTNHHDKYTPDESVFKRGSAVMAQFAVDFLAGK